MKPIGITFFLVLVIGIFVPVSPAFVFPIAIAIGTFIWCIFFLPRVSSRDSLVAMLLGAIPVTVYLVGGSICSLLLNDYSFFSNRTGLLALGSGLVAFGLITFLWHCVCGIPKHLR